MKMKDIENVLELHAEQNFIEAGNFQKFTQCSSLLSTHFTSLNSEALPALCSSPVSFLLALVCAHSRHLLFIALT